MTRIARNPLSAYQSYMSHLFFSMRKSSARGSARIFSSIISYRYVSSEYHSYFCNPGNQLVSMDGTVRFLHQ